MCTCNPNNDDTEEYHTAFSDFETSTPDEWRTSTRYYDEEIPEYISTPRRTPRQEFQRIPRAPIRTIPRRLDLTAGVAIVPRRIDFDAVSDVENFDDEEELEYLAKETLRQLKSAAERSIHIPESTAASGTYKIKRMRPKQFAPQVMKPCPPRMTRVTPCGKCLRM